MLETKELIEKMALEELERWSSVLKVNLELEMIERKDAPEHFVLKSKPIKMEEFPTSLVVESWYIQITLGHRKKENDIVIIVSQHMNMHEGVHASVEVEDGKTSFPVKNDVYRTLKLYARDI